MKGELFECPARFTEMSAVRSTAMSLHRAAKEGDLATLQQLLGAHLSTWKEIRLLIMQPVPKSWLYWNTSEGAI